MTQGLILDKKEKSFIKVPYGFNPNRHLFIAHRPLLRHYFRGFPPRPQRNQEILRLEHQPPTNRKRHLRNLSSQELFQSQHCIIHISLFFLQCFASKAIFKPLDEEPFADNNPKGYPGKLGSPGFRAGIRSGESASREVAAYLLDRKGFHNVPETIFAEMRHHYFSKSNRRNMIKLMN